MEVFKGMGKWGHEQVLFTREESIGYYGIIAIHDTTLGRRSSMFCACRWG
jgi:hypothetical protein